jgi:diguanylate cyclase (GGDEF)-like protein/PAS domain S-box-containing protein
MKMTVARKMLLLTFIAMAGLIGLMVLSQHQMAKVFNAANYSNVTITPRIILLDKIRYKFNTLRIRAVNHTLIEDADKVAEVEVAIRKLQAELGALCKEYESYIADNEDRRLLEEEKAGLNEYYVRMEPILDASRANDKALAHKLYIDIRATAEKANGAIAAHMDYNVKLGQQSAKSAVEAKDSAQQFSMLIGVFILLAIAVMSFMITRNLRRRDELEILVKQRTAHLLRANEELQREMSERKVVEEKNQRLTQLYAALSQCNEAIVRCTSEDELFPKICRSAVQFGGMMMAWIGLVDEASQQVKPVASYGDDMEYLEGIQISTDADDPAGRGPIGIAIRENRPFWCQDFQNDPALTPWHERGVRFGWAAAASLPLLRNGVVIGTFTLYADKINAFDEAARNLLLEMAIDISFALDNFARESERRQAQEALIRSESHIRAYFERSMVGMAATSLKKGWLEVNDTLCAMLGYSREELMRLTWAELTHPDDIAANEILFNRILHGEIEEYTLDKRFVRKDGIFVYVHLATRAVRHEDGSLDYMIALFEDITERKKAEERVQLLVHFDQLTGLPNRALFTDRINHALSMAQRNNEPLSVLFLDLDHFKNINDTLGHSIGDALLIKVAKRLESAVREEDTVSRQGGDEFVLVLPCTDAVGAAHVAEKLLEATAYSYKIEQYELNVTSSIGIAMYPDDGKDFESLFKYADVAMYRAKHDGRNTYRFFTQEMQTHSARTLQLENALRHALELDQLQLHYQPQVSLQDGHIIGAEALLRWQHPEFGAVSPAEFIPVAEASGQILKIGEWVLRSAVHQLKIWMNSGLEPMVIAVNLSAVQFRHPHLPELVTQILEEAKLPPQYLELELTEGVAMDDPLRAIAVMDDLHERGIRMSIDDFGTGYSSLSYLKKFKVYKLKIDQSFVRDITEDPEDKAIVTAIISLANSLGMQTIAEGVETSAQLAFLRLQGCNEVQGYYFSKPLPADQFEAHVRSKSEV